MRAFLKRVANSRSNWFLLAVIKRRTRTSAGTLPQHYQNVAEFWVQAWQAIFRDIDFEARRLWIMGHSKDTHVAMQTLRGCLVEDEPVGFYSLYQMTGLIEQICVSPWAKGLGIGSAMIADAAMNNVYALNLVVTENNYSARQFYAKLGFAEAGRGTNAASSRPTITLQMRPTAFWPFPVRVNSLNEATNLESHHEPRPRKYPDP